MSWKGSQGASDDKMKYESLTDDVREHADLQMTSPGQQLQPQQASVHMSKDVLHEQSPVVVERLSAAFLIYTKKRGWLFHPDPHYKLKLYSAILFTFIFCRTYNNSGCYLMI